MAAVETTQRKVVLIDPATGKPIPPRAHPGYYPGYRTLAQQEYWDEATRKVVLNRIRRVPDIRFFSADEARLMYAICNRILPQDDRDEEHRVPIVPFIDKRLFDGRIDGYRFQSMPPDRQAYNLGLKGIDEIANHLYTSRFLDIGEAEQEIVLKTLHDAKPPAGQEIWDGMSVHRFWMLLVQDCVEVYYAHPWAWDEIGYGGPAYPRGYMRLEGGQPEPWEVEEKRYEWQVSGEFVSDNYEFIAGEAEHFGSPGQGGTH